MTSSFNPRYLIFLFAGVAVIMNTFPSTTTSASIGRNPLTEKWSGPFGGVPPFDKVTVADIKPALEAAMAENLVEYEAIASSKEAPTFENTIVAMERAGAMLDRVNTVYGIWSGNMSTPEFQRIQSEMEPKMAAMSDKIRQNEALFKRIEAVYNSPQKTKLSAEQQRLVWVYYTNFVRSGAKLGVEQKKRLAAINQELAGLFTKFSQNLLGEESELFLTIENEAHLAGLPADLRDSAASAAAAKKKPGAWVIRNTRSAIDPFLTYSDRRDLREKACQNVCRQGR